MTALLALARHELRLLLRDPLPVVLLVLLPLAVMTFLRPALELALFAEGHVTADGAQQAVPGVATTFSLFLVGLVGLTFFRDHAWATWDRLRSAPLTTWQLLAGKVLPLLCVAGGQLALLFLAGVVLFDLQVRGSVLALAVVSAALAATSVALGLALVATARTLSQVNVVANLGTVVVAGVGGALVPVSLLPSWTSAVAPASPAYWAMRGFRAVLLEGGGMAEVALPTAVLTAMAVAAALVALHRLRATGAHLGWT